MSNFFCNICNTPILENKNGEYYTECKHYPKRLNMSIVIKKSKNFYTIEKDNIKGWGWSIEQAIFSLKANHRLQLVDKSYIETQKSKLKF